MESILGLISIKDIVDILLVATLLFYLYRAMKDSGSLNIFMGVLTFVIIWVVLYKILDMQLIGTLMDKFIDIGFFHRDSVPGPDSSLLDGDRFAQRSAIHHKTVAQE